MKALRVLNLPLLTILLTSLPFGAFAQNPTKKNSVSDKARQEQTVGGSNGGGGYQYPNSKLLLKVVSSQLAKEISEMNDQIFVHFPSHLRRKELAKIIQNVVQLPEVYRERPNEDGEMEGLMFDYDRNYCDQSGCGPRIFALKPFFDAYKGEPVKQLEKTIKKSDHYLLIKKDVRERLLHESAHLIDIGNTAATDKDAEEFALRFEQVLKNEYVLCVAKDWFLDGTRNYPGISYDGFIIHLPTGKFGTYWTHRQTLGEEMKSWESASQKTHVVQLLENTKRNKFSEFNDLNSSPSPENFLSKVSATAYKVDLVGETLNWRHDYEDNVYPNGKPVRKKFSRTIDINMRTGEGVLIKPTRDATYYGEDKQMKVEYKCQTDKPLVISLDF